MSFSEENRSTRTVTWPVRIPRETDAKRTTSTTFRCHRGRKWSLQCAESLDTIYLWMYPKGYPLPDQIPSLLPFAISVWVQSATSVFDGLSSTEELQTDSFAIWVHKTSEVQRILPKFGEDRLLHFRIDINEHHPQRGCYLASAIAPHCPQFELHATVANASVQATLTANSISCLDALSEDFSKMMDVGSYPDVQLLCQGHSTRAHKSVLCSRSPVFKMMLNSDMEEGRTGVVNIQDMDVDTFRQLLLYLHTGKLCEDLLTFDLAFSLYEAADMYGIVSLKTFCSDFLRVRLTSENAHDVLAVADAHADTRFVEVVKSYIVRANVNKGRTARKSARPYSKAPDGIQAARLFRQNNCGSTTGRTARKSARPHSKFARSYSKIACPYCKIARPYRKTARPDGTAAPLYIRAYYCPQPEKHHCKSFADASVQTSLTVSSISCLEALSEDFSKMMDSDSDLNVELRCQGHSIWAHESVLCLRSPVLAKMLQRKTRHDGRTCVVNICDVDAGIFQQMFLYLYTGKLDMDALTFDTAMSLYKAADAYGVASLKTLCSDFLRTELTLENASRISAAAEVCADSNLAAAVAAYVDETMC